MRETILESGSRERHYWRDLWHYRELFYILSWRDLAVRYKQTVVGIAWVLIRPILTMVIFTIVFGRIASLSAPGNIPYSLFVFAGLLPWQFFAAALGESSNSLTGNANLISKVYFPRIIIPAATIITSLVDLMISFGLLIILMTYYRVSPGWQIVTLPCFILLAFAAAVGGGLWLCALNVKYRDFRYIVPFVVQFGLYVSPVGFSSSKIPPEWNVLYSLNPMVGVIEGFRWALFGSGQELNITSILISIVTVAITLVTGIKYFRKMESTFADLI